MPSSAMLRRVAPARTDVPEESIASTIMATRIDLLGTKSAVTSNRRALRNVSFYVPEDGTFRSHRHENLKSYIALTGWTL
jgi:hypothetical protein